ncbi:MAG TPA: hypothetical protein VFD82_03435 [Planctomycetota bacterium]|nr:hypothetical protein [Planctomycetota bacterium]
MLAAATEGPAFTLPVFLGIALLLRLPAVLFAHGFFFVDQQFQYVDPAWHLATGQAWHVPWEFIDGLRSWVYPGLLAGIFRLLLSVGCEEPMLLMQAVRAVHAVISLLPVWLFWLLVVRWHPIAAPRLPLLLFAISGLLVVVGVQPSGPTLGAMLAVAAVLAAHGPRWFPALGGLCLGLAFCLRVQEALFGPALLAVLLWQRRRRAAAWFGVGCLPGILLQGFVDLGTNGSFLGSAWDYVFSNIGLGSAEKWRQRWWWYYFAAGVVPVLVLVPPFLRCAWQRLRAGAVVLPGAVAAALLHLAVHSCIGRKALRFEVSALILLFAVVAVGLGTASATPERRAAAWHRWLLIAVHTLLFLWVSFWFPNAGAVRLALALRAEAGFADDVLVVGGDATSLGGFYYLRQDADRVTGVSRDQLAAHLLTRIIYHGRLRVPPVAGGFVVAVREPLPEPAASFLRLDLIGYFAGYWDLSAGERRFLYRWR